MFNLYACVVLHSVILNKETKKCWVLHCSQDPMEDVIGINNHSFITVSKKYVKLWKY